MADLDGSPVDLILYEVVLDDNTFAPFGGNRVLSYQDCSFDVNEDRGGLGLWHVCFEEKSSMPTCLFGCSGGCQVFSFTCEVRDYKFSCLCPADV